MLNAPPPPTATTAAGGTLQGWSVSQDPATSGFASGAGAPPPPAAEAWPRPGPGDLQIKEQRSWRTWQLVVAIAAAAVFGMFIGNVFAGGGTPSAASSGGKTSSTLPPEGAGGGTGGTPGASGTATTAPPSTSATTAPPATASNSSSSSTVPASSGALVVLMGPYQSQGNWTSTSFTVSGTQWNIGWAFRCTPAPTAGSSLQIFVVPKGGKAGAVPAVNETGASGQSVTTQQSPGTQELIVQAPATCQWAVKVTGQQ